MSFNARLLDVVGGLPSHDEVQSIEHWGRYISGTALALAIWGSVVMPRGTRDGWKVSTWVAVLGLSAVVSIYMVYNLEGNLIDHLTDQSDGPTRQRALYLAALRGGILAGHIRVPTMNLTHEELSAPEGKTFAALFPVLAYSDNGLISKADKALVPAVQAGVAQSFADRFGNASQACAKYWKVVLRFGGLFNQYADGLDRLHDQLADIPRKQEAAWQDYVSGLPDSLTPETVPENLYETVREKVRAGGVNVAADWIPSDQKGFYEAYADQARTEAHNAFQKAVRDRFGPDVTLPEDLTIKTYFNLPNVQQRMRQALGLPESIELPGVADGPTFERLVYDPMLVTQVDNTMLCYRSNPSTLADGGSKEQAGRRVMRALLVPPIALAFSLIGALVHVTKFLNYSLRIFVNRAWLNIRTIGLAVALVALCAFAAPNDVTKSEGYGTMKEETRANLGSLFVVAFNWVIQAQHFAYPFDEAVRVHILDGWTFGYPSANAAHQSPDPCVPSAS
ncbi:MAG: hypothetical protein ABSD74_00145 [Rhizomicrobium sp.]